MIITVTRPSTTHTPTATARLTTAQFDRVIRIKRIVIVARVVIALHTTIIQTHLPNNTTLAIVQQFVTA